MLIIAHHQVVTFCSFVRHACIHFWFKEDTDLSWVTCYDEAWLLRLLSSLSISLAHSEWQNGVNMERRFFWVEDLNILKITSAFEKQNLTNISADDEPSIAEPCMTYEVGRYCGGLTVIFTIETGMVYFKRILIGNFVIFKHIFARYNNGVIVLRTKRYVTCKLIGCKSDNISCKTLHFLM
jgi:hypothetical protein